jgi:amino-acid N-acetyltransferase
MVAKINTAVADDWPSIRSHLELAGLPVEDLGPSHMSRFLVARSNDRSLLGAIGLEQFGNIGLLRSLVVVDDARCQGLGRELVLRLEKFALELSISELWLLTIDADKFFKQIGFLAMDREQVPDEVAATKEFSELCPANAFLMQKILQVN